MFVTVIFFTSALILLILFALKERYLFINEQTTDKIRKIHQKPMIKIGGFSLLPFLISSFYIADDYLLLLVLTSLPIFILGLIDDLNESISAFKRLIILIVIIFLYIYLSDLQIRNIGIGYIDFLLNKYSILAILFTSLCLLLTINGFNLIDGQHGLMLGHSLIVILFIYHLLPADTVLMKDVFINLFCVVVLLFIANYFTGMIKSGDCGSYFLGYLVGSLTICAYKFYNIDPFEIACLLFYPVFEFIFSFFRRILNNSDPFLPDNKHLHSLLFRILQNNEILNKLQTDNINRLTTFIILLFLSCFFLILKMALFNVNYKVVLLMLVFIYLISYRILSKENIII